MKITMHKPITLLLFLAAFLAIHKEPFAQGQNAPSTYASKDEAAQQVIDKLGKLIFPKIEVHQATLREVINFVFQKSKELDPTGQGVAIHLDPSLGEISDERLTLSLAHIPEYELLRYITSLANAKLIVSKDGVTITR